MTFATEKNAHGFCDRCQFRYPLKELKSETINGTSAHNRICPECWDKDHEQRFLWRIRTDDPTALRDPRPPLGLEDSRRLSAWKPVGHITTSRVYANVGKVTVTTS